MPITAHIINAFTNDGPGGNPAAVVLNADTLTQVQKQTIAKEVGLSETAFVSESQIADIKLEFFTPNRQIAHCGHATIATFSFLSEQGLLSTMDSSKETIDGVRQVKLLGNHAYMEQLAPKISSVKDQYQALLTALSLQNSAALLQESDLIAEPKVVDTGNRFLLLGLKDKAKLATLQVDQKRIAEISEILDLIGIYVFSLETYSQEADTTARMFAPRYEILEEAATGMAAGPLGCYLYQDLSIKKNNYVIEQGYAMTPPSPSKLVVKLMLEDQQITSLLVGGKARWESSINIDV